MYFQSENFTLYHGDNRQILPTLAENSVDAIVTDPPYELGFMGKSWDASGVAFDPATWREALRVLKPGGHLIAFSGSRTYHRMAVAIEDAGFEIRDQIMWIYGSGFPKSHNLKDEWQGWGTALKPAHEPMVLARKPFIGTVAANVLTYGTGGLNIDGARVGTETIISRGGRSDSVTGDERKGAALGMYGAHEPLNTEHTGRWPANVIHDGSDEVVDLFPDTKSGTLNRANITAQNKTYGARPKDLTGEYEANSGSAARFFYCAKASKRDRNEGLDGFEEIRVHDGREEGGVGGSNPRNRTNNYRQNHHPTVKPTDLMRYLCRLITPPNGTVLDPFMGSGSTGKAAMYEGFKFIGIEMTDDYLPIAKVRIEFAVSENEGFLL